MTIKPPLPKTGRIKIVLLILGFLIALGILVYTHRIVAELERNQKAVAGLYARSIEYLASDATGQGDVSFVFHHILPVIDFPLAITDKDGNPLTPVGQSTRNIALDTTLAPEMLELRLRELIAEMDRSYRPIPVTFVMGSDTVILSYVHYGDSPLIKQLRMLPYIEFLAAALFILIGYISFSYVKRSEQSSIWVGMARETAHQLGTPLSSLLGWLELLKSSKLPSKERKAIVGDMENDLQRLQKIAARFSKIGSKPELEPVNLTDLIERTFHYFERRLPQLGKRVRLELKGDRAIVVRANPELFEWVVENLIKNALDAIENSDGAITCSLERSGKYVLLDIADSGKGIESPYKKDIFRPGFSTKKRGWGLGLTLSKRIVETYHGGTLQLKESIPGIGTTFRIRLRL